MVDEAPHKRRVDDALLRHLQQLFGQLELVSKTVLFPANRQESLVVEFETDHYPESVETVRLEIRVYINGDFHVTYFENYLGERRHCRWDRHDQNHNSRGHFHPLPTASTQDARDRAFPADVTEVMRRAVLPWVDERFGDLRDEESS